MAAMEQIWPADFQHLKPTIAKSKPTPSQITKSTTNESWPTSRLQIRLKPDYADAYNNRGGAYFKLGQYQSAVKDFSEAIRLKPDYADAYNNRGGAYFNLGNQKPGCYDAQKACKMGNCIALLWAKKRNYCH